MAPAKRRRARTWTYVVGPPLRRGRNNLKRALVTADRPIASTASRRVHRERRLPHQPQRQERDEDELSASGAAEIEPEAVAWAWRSGGLGIAGARGRPAAASFLDPRAFLVPTCSAVHTGAVHSSQAEPRIEAVAQMVDREWPEPFPEQR